MLTFACKRIDKEDLFRCSFELNKTEYNLLMFLMKHDKWMRVMKIAEMMKMDRSSIQKAMKKLLEKNLVKRFQKNLEKGGYVYFYKVNEKERIKREMMDIITSWYKAVEKEIERM